MPQQKLTIVPFILHTENKKSLSSTSSKEPSISICTINTANAEITFYGSVDERVIQTIMRELKHHHYFKKTPSQRKPKTH
ncbi:hypothetical protein [Bacillus wiedmannii]|uniref:Uncharacterized protein n=1 Tax=Bacillus wiedmannii TaxID=1890302 RepID=A0A2C5PGJ3_9BACI|nr:hypothetical protein [Bacillus wiedmannii]PGD64019.1 hypothetical protein COM41_12200 [Bacillus wiedmannii]PHG57219.1 hypothetical protein COI65_23290 [Bacillus wiedmannii]